MAKRKKKQRRSLRPIVNALKTLERATAQQQKLVNGNVRATARLRKLAIANARALKKLEVQVRAICESSAIGFYVETLE